MKAVTKTEFNAFLAARPLATPDGFRQVGGYTQTRWFENGKEVARVSSDARGHIYEIAE